MNIKEDEIEKIDVEIVNEVDEVDEIDEFDGLDEIDIDMLIPNMNIGNNIIEQEEKDCFIKDEALLGLYDEILGNCRDDRNKVDEILSNFLEMVMNDGDASSASKEAIVNLMKIKSDSADKMSKIADLKTRIKLKDKDTFPRYLAAQQNNKVVIEGSKRDLIKSINKMTNKKSKQNDK